MSEGMDDGRVTFVLGKSKVPFHKKGVHQLHPRVPPITTTTCRTTAPPKGRRWEHDIEITTKHSHVPRSINPNSIQSGINFGKKNSQGLIRIGFVWHMQINAKDSFARNLKREHLPPSGRVNVGHCGGEFFGDKTADTITVTSLYKPEGV